MINVYSSPSTTAIPAVINNKINNNKRNAFVNGYNKITSKVMHPSSSTVTPHTTHHISTTSQQGGTNNVHAVMSSNMPPDSTQFNGQPPGYPIHPSNMITRPGIPPNAYVMEPSKIGQLNQNHIDSNIMAHNNYHSAMYANNMMMRPTGNYIDPSQPQQSYYNSGHPAIRQSLPLSGHYSAQGMHPGLAVVPQFPPGHPAYTAAQQQGSLPHYMVAQQQAQQQQQGGGIPSPGSAMRLQQQQQQRLTHPSQASSSAAPTPPMNNPMGLIAPNGISMSSDHLANTNGPNLVRPSTSSECSSRDSAEVNDQPNLSRLATDGSSNSIGSSMLPPTHSSTPIRQQKSHVTSLSRRDGGGGMGNGSGPATPVAASPAGSCSMPGEDVDRESTMSSPSWPRTPVSPSQQHGGSRHGQVNLTSNHTPISSSTPTISAATTQQQHPVASSSKESITSTSSSSATNTIQRLMGEIPENVSPQERLDRQDFYQRLVQFSETNGHAITSQPTVSRQTVDLYRLYLEVKNRGGFEEVCRNRQWKAVLAQLCTVVGTSNHPSYQLRKQYAKHLLPYNCFYERSNQITAQAVVSSVEHKRKPRVGPDGTPIPSGGGRQKKNQNPTTTTTISPPPHHPPIEGLINYQEQQQQQQQQLYNNYSNRNNNIPSSDVTSIAAAAAGSTNSFAAQKAQQQQQQQNANMGPPTGSFDPHSNLQYQQQQQPESSQITTQQQTYQSSSVPLPQPPTEMVTARDPFDERSCYFGSNVNQPTPPTHPGAQATPPYVGNHYSVPPIPPPPPQYSSIPSSNQPINFVNHSAVLPPPPPQPQQQASSVAPPLPPPQQQQQPPVAPQQPMLNYHPQPHDRYVYTNQPQQPINIATQRPTVQPTAVRPFDHQHQPPINFYPPQVVQHSAFVPPTPTPATISQQFNDHQTKIQLQNELIRKQKQKRDLPTSQSIPINSVETTQMPYEKKRRKITQKELGPIDPWRIVMSLKSGLLIDNTWALNVLNILLYDDRSALFFGLQKMPCLLDALVQQLSFYAAKLFGLEAMGIDDDDDAVDKEIVNDLPEEQQQPNPIVPEYQGVQELPLHVVDSRWTTSGHTLPFIHMNVDTHDPQEHSNISTRLPNLQLNDSVLHCHRPVFQLNPQQSNDNNNPAFNCDQRNDVAGGDDDAYSNERNDSYRRMLAQRCLCISNILRGLSFIPTNDKEMVKNVTLLKLLGKLLNQHEQQPTCSTNNNNNNNNNNHLIPFADNEWYSESLHGLHDDCFVMLCNFAANLNFGHMTEQVIFPILDSLLFWATASGSYATDPIPLFNCVVSPQLYSLEILCKLVVQEVNVDMIIATPPWQRLDVLMRQMAQSLSPQEKLPLKEFAIVLTSSLASANESVAFILASETCTIQHLVIFLEIADANMHQVVTQQGMPALRDNPELMGTSVGMLRRAASTLHSLARIASNRTKFSKFQVRLLNLTMSQLMDSRVAATVAEVLFLLQKDESSSVSKKKPSIQTFIPNKQEDEVKVESGDEVVVKCEIEEQMESSSGGCFGVSGVRTMPMDNGDDDSNEENKEILSESMLTTSLVKSSLKHSNSSNNVSDNNLNIDCESTVQQVAGR